MPANTIKPIKAWRFEGYLLFLIEAGNVKATILCGQNSFNSRSAIDKMFYCDALVWPKAKT
jgi:hypothetical protein